MINENIRGIIPIKGGLTMFYKSIRNKVMKKICNHFTNAERQFMDINILYSSLDMDKNEINKCISVLESMSYITYKKNEKQSRPFIQITNNGHCYFETIHDEHVKFIRNKSIDFIALIISIIALVVSLVSLFNK